MWEKDSYMCVWEEAEIIVLMHSITLKWLRDLWSCNLLYSVKFIQAKLPPTT